jgi:hypothetical protein
LVYKIEFYVLLWANNFKIKMQLCCVEDPSDVSILKLNGRDLNQVLSC